MTIHYTTGDILANDHLCEALVNPVNCVGIAGKGLALRFKQAFRGAHDVYVGACKLDKVQVGHVYAIRQPAICKPEWIVCFPTKKHWRDPSRLEWIKDGLVALRHMIEAKDIKSIAIPALGAGLGGLRWDDVRQAIEYVLENLDADVWVYKPQGDT